MYRHWTAAEDRFFRKYGNKEIARRTGRPITSVQSRKQKLRGSGVVLPYLVRVRREAWTPAKDKIVAENPPGLAMRRSSLNNLHVRIRCYTIRSCLMSPAF
jgi:hypothetical protein